MSTASMSPTAMTTPVATTTDAEIHITRRGIDRILVGLGAVGAAFLLVAGTMLMWGSNFAGDYVGKELSSQNIIFPSAEALTTEGRTDLVRFAGQELTTGEQAQAYASYIDGHLQNTADGQTYAELGTVQRAAAAAVTDAKDAGQPQATIDELQAKATAINTQRDTLFKGETLRGLLLSAYAWSTVGRIAGIAAWVALAAGAVMVVLVVLGIVHERRSRKATATA